MARFFWVIAPWKSPRGVLKTIRSYARWMSLWEVIFARRIPIAFLLRMPLFSSRARRPSSPSFPLFRALWAAEVWQKCIFFGKATRSGLVVREGVKEFRITYLDPQSEQEKWEERWDAKERNTLPRAIRLHYLTK